MPVDATTLTDRVAKEVMLEMGQLPDGTSVWSNTKSRKSINKKLWLNETNDLFFFAVEAHSSWRLLHAMVVRESSLQKAEWMDGLDLKYLKREAVFQYTPEAATSEPVNSVPTSRLDHHHHHPLLTTPHQATHHVPLQDPQGLCHSAGSGSGSGSGSGGMAQHTIVAACRLCRLPWASNDDEAMPRWQEVLVPFAVFGEVGRDGRLEEEAAWAHSGRLSAVEGSGKDVRSLLQQCAEQPGLACIQSRQAFAIKYDCKSSRQGLLPCEEAAMQSLSHFTHLLDATACTAPSQLYSHSLHAWSPPRPLHLLDTSSSGMAATAGGHSPMMLRVPGAGEGGHHPQGGYHRREAAARSLTFPGQEGSDAGTSVHPAMQAVVGSDQPGGGWQLHAPPALVDPRSPGVRYHPAGWPAAGQHPGRYPGQHPAGQYPGQFTGQHPGQHPGQYTGQHPGQYSGQYSVVHRPVLASAYRLAALPVVRGGSPPGGPAAYGPMPGHHHDNMYSHEEQY